MGRIQLTVRYQRIPRANLGVFKALATQVLEVARGEAGMVRCDWFFNDDETVSVVRATFANSDAVLEHMARVDELLGKLARISGAAECEAFGRPSARLREASAFLRSPVFAYFQGMGSPPLANSQAADDILH